MSVIELMKGPFGLAFMAMFTVLLAIAIMAWFRACCCKPSVNYTAVNHGLDEEEMAFKRSMETQRGDGIDELFNFSGQEELEFDRNDLDSIEMTATYRSKDGGSSKRTDGAVEVGHSKEDASFGPGEGAGAATNGAAMSSMIHEEDIGREAEDLEALLDGEYLQDGRGSVGGSVEGSERRSADDRGEAGLAGEGSGMGTEKLGVEANGRT